MVDGWKEVLRVSWARLANSDETLECFSRDDRDTSMGTGRVHSENSHRLRHLIGAPRLPATPQPQARYNARGFNRMSTTTERESDKTGTPAMRQYHNIKRQVPDAILFFRMGDFY